MVILARAEDSSGQGTNWLLTPSWPQPIYRENVTPKGEEGLWGSPRLSVPRLSTYCFILLSYLVPKASFLWLSPLLSPTLSISLPPAILALPCHNTFTVTMVSPVSHPLSICPPITSITLHDLFSALHFLFLPDSLPLPLSPCLLT